MPSTKCPFRRAPGSRTAASAGCTAPIADSTATTSSLPTSRSPVSIARSAAASSTDGSTPSRVVADALDNRSQVIVVGRRQQPLGLGEMLPPVRGRQAGAAKCEQHVQFDLATTVLNAGEQLRPARSTAVPGQAADGDAAAAAAREFAGGGRERSRRWSGQGGRESPRPA